MRVGEQFEDIERSVVLFTGETGPALCRSCRSAPRILSHRWTRRRRISRLGYGDPVDPVEDGGQPRARPVDEDMSRSWATASGKLNVDSLAGAMMRFGLSGKDADDALASFMQSAQELGRQPACRWSTRSSTSGAVLHDLGLSAEQAGQFVGRLQQLGPAGAGGIAVLEKAMKEAGKEGKTLKEFLQEETEFLNGPATDAAKDAEAADVFGAKKWEEARDAVKAYQETLEENPDKLRGQPAKISTTVADKTQSLANKWDQLSNTIKSMAAFDLGRQ